MTTISLFSPIHLGVRETKLIQRKESRVTLSHGSYINNPTRITSSKRPGKLSTAQLTVSTLKGFPQ